MASAANRSLYVVSIALKRRLSIVPSAQNTKSWPCAREWTTANASPNTTILSSKMPRDVCFLHLFVVSFQSFFCMSYKIFKSHSYARFCLSAGSQNARENGTETNGTPQGSLRRAVRLGSTNRAHTAPHLSFSHLKPGHKGYTYIPARSWTFPDQSNQHLVTLRSHPAEARDFGWIL
jgi:hypothetical protein